jgi:hypothetical protein
MQVSDVSSGNTVFQQATIVQKKTEVPVTFEITDATRASVQRWIEEAKLLPGDFLWRSRNGKSRHLSMSQYSPVIRKILKHLQEKSPRDSGVRIPNPRAPPQASLFG